MEIGSERLVGRRSLARHGRLPGDRRGAILPLVALSLVGVMSLMALAVEAGSLHRERRTAQTAADAGATAGAHEIFRDMPKDSVDSAAYYETARNGFTNGANGVTVIPYNGPISGPHAGDTQFVEVVITRPVATVFGALLGRNSVTIHVRAVAGIPAPSDNCLYTLDPSDEKALNVSGSTTRLDADCGVVVNSNDRSKAVLIESAGTLTATSLAVVGGIDQSGGTIVINPGTTSTGVPPSNDPLAYLSVPPFCSASPNPSCVEATTCDYSNTKVSSGNTVTLNPGIYCGGMEIDGTVTLTAGLYILRGGGLKMGSGRITGTGVTFINTNATAANGGAGKFQKIELGSASRANLSAPTTGPMAGILFFQDPAAGKPGDVYENVIASGSTAVFNGTLYFPTQPIELGASGSTTTINGGVVAQTVKVTSGSRVTMDMTGGLTGEIPVKRVSLVE